MSATRPWRDVRGRLLIVVLSALVVALATAIFGFNSLFTTTSDQNANELVRSRAASALATLSIKNGHIRLGETRTDEEIGSRVWVFQGRRLVETPPAPPSVDVAARKLADGPGRFHDVSGTDLSLIHI